MKTACVFCVVLILAVLPTKILSQGPDLVSKICEATLYKDLCNAILRSDPASKSADLHGLAKIVMNVAEKNATDLQAQIAKMVTSTQPVNDNFLLACLKECAESYQEVMERIKESKPALEAKRYSDVSTWMSTAMTDADTCDECFTEKPNLQSPIGELSKSFTQIVSIELAITKALTAH